MLPSTEANGKNFHRLSRSFLSDPEFKLSGLLYSNLKEITGMEGQVGKPLLLLLLSLMPSTVTHKHRVQKPKPGK